jgi:drug/metabolite transporter (DMT)-like permease
MNRGHIYLILAALSYATMGALVKVLGTNLQPLTQTFLRLVVSLILTLILVVCQKQKLSLKKKVDYLLLLFMGTVGYGLQIILYTESLYQNTIGNVLFIFSAYPIITAILAAVILKEKLKQRSIIAFILLFAVMFLIFNPNHIQSFLTGNLEALGACICFALYVICTRIVLKHKNSPSVITFWSIALGVLTSGIGTAALERGPILFSNLTIMIIFLFGFFNFAAWNLINKGFQTINAGIGTMILAIEPVIGSVLGIIFFREIPSPTFIVGALEMLLAIYIASFRIEG